MKRFIPLNDLFDKLKKRKITTWLDNLTFFRIFLIWASTILVFGSIYFILSSKNGYLWYPSRKEITSTLVDSIYFSFVTATSTGYGDIIPLGLFRVIAITQAIFGLLLLAFVTSKLISIKQDIILSEIYDISFSEKINRLRSSLLVFRQSINRIINKIEENSVRKREIHDLYLHFSSFEDILHEIHTLLSVPKEEHFKKVVDPLQTELLLNSIISSFEKTNEVLAVLNQSKPDWRRDITIDLINRCISLSNMLFNKETANNLSEKTLSDLANQKNKIIELIKAALALPVIEKKE